MQYREDNFGSGWMNGGGFACQTRRRAGKAVAARGEGRYVSAGMTGGREKTRTSVAWVAALGLAALGCRTAPPTTTSDPMALRGIDFRAHVEVEDDSPSRIHGWITIHNRRSTSALLTFPVACYGLLRAYEESARMAAVWEQPADGCPEEAVRLSLMAGEERTIPLADVDVAAVLADGLPSGSYRFTVVTAPDGHILEIEAGEEELER